MNKKIIALIGAIIVILCVVILFVSKNNVKYEVKFNTNGGTIIETQTIKKGETAKRPSNPTKDGYVFDDWYLNNEKYDFNKEVTENLVLEAKWVKEVIDEKETYTITFNTDGGNKVASIKVIEGEKISKPDTITKDGYKFLGWYLNDTEFDFSQSITKDITLKAKWEKIKTDNNKPSKPSKPDTTKPSKPSKPDTTKPSNPSTPDTKPDTKPTEPEKVSVKSVSLNKTSLSLKVGDTAKLEVTINPSDATNKNATWKSSDTSVVTVDANGNIKAIKAGNATITVTVDGKSATAKITVIKEVTYSIAWVDVKDSSIGQAMLYIKSSEGNYVSGVVEITTIDNKVSRVEITETGKMYIKAVIANAKVISTK